MRRRKSGRSAAEFAQARSAGEAFLGVEVSWDMGETAVSLSIPRQEFEDLFVANGAPRSIFLPRPTPATSLALASRIGWSQQTQVSADRISVKVLSKPLKDTPISLGVFYRISEAGERDRWELGARVRIVQTAAVVQTPPDVASYPSVDAQVWAEQIAQFANDAVHTASNADISKALRAFGDRLGWISRRERGGVYFLPGNSGERFVAVLDGLQDLTSLCVPPFAGDVTCQFADPRTFGTWQRRAVQTFEEEIESLVVRLSEMSAESNTREQTFDARILDCGELIVRAQQYATILEGKLKPIVSKVDELKKRFANARDSLIVSRYRVESALDRACDLVSRGADVGKRPS